jgi:hypothetical protein
MPHSYKYNRYSRYEPWDFVLPTGEQMNPLHPEGAVYFDRGQSVYVLRRLDVLRSRPSRIVTTYGATDTAVGERVSVFHDQTGAFLGDYEIVGTHNFSTGAVVGEVPNRLIPQSVFK